MSKGTLAERGRRTGERGGQRSYYPARVAGVPGHGEEEAEGYPHCMGASGELHGAGGGGPLFCSSWCSPANPLVACTPTPHGDDGRIQRARGGQWSPAEVEDRKATHIRSARPKDESRCLSGELLLGHGGWPSPPPATRAVQRLGEGSGARDPTDPHTGEGGGRVVSPGIAGSEGGRQ